MEQMMPNDYQMKPNQSKKTKDELAEDTEARRKKWKKTRGDILDEIDSFLTEEIVDRAAEAGYPEVGAGIASVASGLAHQAPESPEEAMLMGLPAGAAAAKIGRVVKAGKRARQGKRAAKAMRKDVQKQMKRERVLPEKPHVDDDLYKQGYYKKKMAKQRRLDRKRGKSDNTNTEY